MIGATGIPAARTDDVGDFADLHCECLVFEFFRELPAFEHAERAASAAEVTSGILLGDVFEVARRSVEQVVCFGFVALQEMQHQGPAWQLLPLSRPHRLAAVWLEDCRPRSDHSLAVRRLAAFWRSRISFRANELRLRSISLLCSSAELLLVVFLRREMAAFFADHFLEVMIWFALLLSGSLPRKHLLLSFLFKVLHRTGFMSLRI